MNTEEFFRWVLPTQGFYVLAIFVNGMDSPPKQLVVTDLAVLAQRALLADKHGHPTYHAVNSFVAHRKKRMRVGDNVAFARCQILDIDVGRGKDYATRSEALAALKQACKTLAIPAPMVVASGPRGLHVYWRMDRDIPAVEARHCAEAFSSACKAIGFKHDTTRTCDIASILRPVGTHNRKEKAHEVTVLFHPQKEVNWDKWAAKFSSLPTGNAPSICGAQSPEVFIAGIARSFEKADAKRIASRCQVIKAAWVSNGRVEEPFWRATLGLFKHCEEGESLAHKWSSGHPDYTKSATQDKLDGWQVPPPTCDALSGYGPGCDGCPHKGSINSPIALGVSKKQPVKPPRIDNVSSDMPSDALHYSCIEPDDANTGTLPYFDHAKYTWDGVQLHALVEKKGKGGSVWHQWEPFSNTLYYPFLRYETEENTRAIKVCALVDQKKNKWRIFDIETTKVAEPQALAYALGAHEVLYMPDTKNVNRQYVQDMLYGIREAGLETTTYNTFGWHGDGFVVGDTKYIKNDAVKIFLGSKVPEDLHGTFGVKGTALEWARIINLVYNRHGAEAYQFAICAGLAAPLVKLTDSDMFHGIPLALTGVSGKGKSTTGKVACSAWGDPRKTSIQANADGTTLNALIQRVSTMRNLPILLDEITGRTTEELQSMLFALSNGKPKMRLRSDGTEINANQAWDTISFITGNISITKMLANSDRMKAEATQVRCFEIQFDDSLEGLFSDINAKDLIENQLLANNYGAAGVEFIKAVLRRKDKITAELQRQRSRVVPKNADEQKERFYYDLIAITMVGASIAKQIGLISFDLERMRRWAMNHVKAMRGTRSSSLDTPEDYLQAFLSSLHQHTIQTKFYRDGRQKLPDESVVEPMREPLARNAVEDRRFIVTRKAYTDWCHKNSIDPTWLQAQLEKLGYLLPASRNDIHRLCRGTNMSGSQSRCLELNYDQIDSQKISLPEYISSAGGQQIHG